MLREWDKESWYAHCDLWVCTQLEEEQSRFEVACIYVFCFLGLGEATKTR